MLKVFKERVDDAMEFHIIIIMVDILFDKIIYTPIISYHIIIVSYSSFIYQIVYNAN